MKPEHYDEAGIQRFWALFLHVDRKHGEGEYFHAGASALESQALHPTKIAQGPRHTHDCPAETGEAAICTCGALYRIALAAAA